MKRALLCAVILITSCRTRLIDSPLDDGGVPSDGGAPADLLQTMCVTHDIEFVTLASLDQVDPQLGLHVGEAVRVRIGVPLRTGCDTLGDVAVDAMPGNATDFVRISARVWKGSAACGAVQSVPRVITIDGSMLGNLELQVHDGAPGGTLALQIMRQPPLSMSCAAVALGANCQNDCQCQKTDGRSRCLAGTKSLCAIPCTEDVDCPSERPHCHQAAVANQQTFVCDADLEGCCAGGCPFGQACTGCVCKSAAKPTSAGCMCDRDCGAGELCSSDHGCFVPCTDVAECAPGQNVCGGGECSSTK